MKNFQQLTLILLSSFFLIQCRQQSVDFIELQANFDKKLSTQFTLFSLSQNAVLTPTIPFPDDSTLNSHLHFISVYQDNLSGVDSMGLNDNSLLAFRQMKRTIEELKQEINNHSKHRLRADYHNARKFIQPILNQKGLSLNERLQLISRKIIRIPSYYKLAQQYVHESPIQNTELAISEHIESFSFFENTLLDSLNTSTLPQPKRIEMKQHLATTGYAIKDYIAFCNSLKFEFNEAIRKEDEASGKVVDAEK